MTNTGLVVALMGLASLATVVGTTRLIRWHRLDKVLEDLHPEERDVAPHPRPVPWDVIACIAAIVVADAGLLWALLAN